jgi:hypothetical protein
VKFYRCRRKEPVPARPGSQDLSSCSERTSNLAMRRSAVLRSPVTGLLVSMVLAGILGCTYTLKSSEIPSLQVGSPLKGVPPAVLAFKEFREVTGRGQNLGTFGRKTVSLDQPPAAVVSGAVKREFERNGHRCVVNPDQPGVDFVVEGTVYKYDLSMDPGLFVNRFNGIVGTKLIVRSNRSEEKEFAKNYEGRSQGTTFRAVNDALVEMVKEVSRDTELVEFIRR